MEERWLRWFIGLYKIRRKCFTGISILGKCVFIDEKFQGGVFLFCDALSAESEGSFGAYENLKLTALLCCCFSLSQYKIM